MCSQASSPLQPTRPILVPSAEDCLGSIEPIDRRPANGRNQRYLAVAARSAKVRSPTLCALADRDGPVIAESHQARDLRNATNRARALES